MGRAVTQPPLWYNPLCLSPPLHTLFIHIHLSPSQTAADKYIFTQRQIQPFLDWTPALHVFISGQPLHQLLQASWLPQIHSVQAPKLSAQRKTTATTLTVVQYLLRICSEFDVLSKYNLIPTTTLKYTSNTIHHTMQRGGSVKSHNILYVVILLYWRSKNEQSFGFLNQSAPIRDCPQRILQWNV